MTKKKEEKQSIGQEIQPVIDINEIIVEKKELTYFEQQLILHLEEITESLRILCTTQAYSSRISYSQLRDQADREEKKYDSRKIS